MTSNPLSRTPGLRARRGRARLQAGTNNFAIDSAVAYYAGRVAPKVGAFIELNYDGVASKPH